MHTPPGRSFTEALVNYVTDDALELDRKEDNGIQSLLMDYNKAFEGMDHAILLNNMVSECLVSQTTRPTQSFLANRSASVVIGDPAPNRIQNHKATSLTLYFGMGLLTTCHPGPPS